MSQTGDIKRDSTTGAVAIRTNQPEESDSFLVPSQAWLVATPTSGARFVSSEVVEEWESLYSAGDG